MTKIKNTKQNFAYATINAHMNVESVIKIFPTKIKE